MPFPTYAPVPTKLVTLNEADDSEPLAAATTNVSLEQLADGVAWLNARLRVYNANSSGSGVVYAWTAPGNDGLFTYVDATTVVLDVAGCLTGDVLLMSLSSNVQYVGADAGLREVRVNVIEDYGGAGTVRNPAGRIVLSAAGDGTRYGGVSLHNSHTIITAGPARIVVQAGFTNTTGYGMELREHWNISAIRVRD